MRPRFTIITCTFNSAKYLQYSINSVLNQGFKDFEYIFVDGGSTDGTLELINAVPGNKKVLNGVDGGISKAMNVGIDVASGEIIAHLHSDDYYLNGNVLQLVSNYFNDESIEWLFGGQLEVINGREVSLPYVVPNYSYKKLLRGNFIPHHSTFVKRSLFNKVGGFDERLRYAMDYEMWLRLGRCSQPRQIEELLAAFRVHLGSLSSSRPLAGLAEGHRIRMRQPHLTMAEKIEFIIRYLVRRYRLRSGVILE